MNRPLSAAQFASETNRRTRKQWALTAAGVKMTAPLSTRQTQDRAININSALVKLQTGPRTARR